MPPQGESTGFAIEDAVFLSERFITYLRGVREDAPAAN
jgi:hypothetical protein